MPNPDNGTYQERTLLFVLNISTELGEGDDTEPTIDYVQAWLTEKGYDSVLAESHIEPDA